MLGTSHGSSFGADDPEAAIYQHQYPYQYQRASVHGVALDGMNSADEMSTGTSPSAEGGDVSSGGPSESGIGDVPSPIRQAQSRAAARIRYVRQSGARSQVEARARAALRVVASGQRTNARPRPRPRHRGARRHADSTAANHVHSARRSLLPAARKGQVAQQEQTQAGAHRAVKRAGTGALPSPARIAQAHTAEAMVRLMQLHTHATLALADEEAK